MPHACSLAQHTSTHLSDGGTAHSDVLEVVRPDQGQHAADSQIPDFGRVGLRDTITLQSDVHLTKQSCLKPAREATLHKHCLPSDGCQAIPQLDGANHHQHAEVATPLRTSGVGKPYLGRCNSASLLLSGAGTADVNCML